MTELRDRHAAGRNRILRWAQLLLAILLLGFLLFGSGARPVLALLKGLDPGWFAAGVGLILFALFLRAISFSWLVAPEVSVRNGFLVKTSLIGSFFTNFLPSHFGGDVVSGLYLRRFFPSLTETYTALLVQRGLGFAGTLVVAFACLPYALTRLHVSRNASLGSFLGIAVLLIIGLLAWYLSGRYRFSEDVQPKGRLGRFVRALHAYRFKTKAILANLILSCVGTILAALMYVIAARSLHVDWPMTVIILPAIVGQLSVVIPLTPGGLGVLEGAFVGCAVAMGADKIEAVSIAAVVRCLILVASLIGGVLYLLHPLGSSEQPVADE